jgi:ubiquinone/menaquinone biosynthesis C-methylase UbiE
LQISYSESGHGRQDAGAPDVCGINLSRAGKMSALQYHENCSAGLELTPELSFKTFLSMDEHLQRETSKLTGSWMQHDEAMLREYLVSGLEDPRRNVQSVLARHFLISALTGERFAALFDHELRFAPAMAWMAAIIEESGCAEDLAAVTHALELGADNAEGTPIPSFVSISHNSLPATVELPPPSSSRSSEGSQRVVIPNYILAALSSACSQPAAPTLTDSALETFQHIWRGLLDQEQAASVSVLEPACGSANDYRFFDAFGLGRLIDYTGFDLCEKNVRNAKGMFPLARFAVGNAFAIPFPAQAFDYCVVHDLFEHLSIEGLHQALDEICRVTRQGLCLGFFSMHEGAEHIIRPIDDYHVNTLSAPLLRQLLEAERFVVQVIHIGTYMKVRFGCGETHNANAYTLIAERNH